MYVYSIKPIKHEYVLLHSCLLLSKLPIFF